MEGSNKLVCRGCGVEMKHHTVSSEEPPPARVAAAAGRESGGILEDFHACPVCGAAETQARI
jgi:hypothetical protein